MEEINTNNIYYIKCYEYINKYYIGGFSEEKFKDIFKRFINNDFSLVEKGKINITSLNMPEKFFRSVNLKVNEGNTHLRKKVTEVIVYCSETYKVIEKNSQGNIV